MKNFFTSMLGTLAALCLFAFGCFLLFVGIVAAIGSAVAKKAPTESLESGSYLVVDLSTNITDAPPAFDFSALEKDRDHADTLQLRVATRALRAAAGDSRIAGVLLKGSLRPAGYGSGYAALSDVRAALLAFRKSGKPVRAYLDAPTLRDYYLESAANEIDLDPYATLFLPGLAAEPIFLKGAFDKYGVGIQVSRVGKYKSAVEMLTRSDMSPEDRVQLQQLLDGIWQNLLAAIGRERGLTPAAIVATADADGLIRADEAKKAHLVDQVLYRDQVVDQLKAATGRAGSKESFKQISLEGYAKLLPSVGLGNSPKVAVVYAEGEIVDGDGQPGEVGGDKYAEELRKLRTDDSVKAVVLRVNSPGGSVTASEEIEREIQLLRQVKPVIVSMGTYAASGGYWISAGADRIFAEPTTVTGSIGVFGIQFDVQKLAADYGVTFDRVKTGKFADAETVFRPKTPEEMAIIQREIDWIYSQFIDKVAVGRKLPRTRVEEIAQGRVWSGADAKRLGLVDQLGGLTSAIPYAAEKAALGANYRIVEYPGKKDLQQELEELFNRFSDEDARASATGLVGKIGTQLTTELAALRTFNDPRGLYARLPFEMEIK